MCAKIVRVSGLLGHGPNRGVQHNNVPRCLDGSRRNSFSNSPQESWIFNFKLLRSRADRTKGFLQILLSGLLGILGLAPLITHWGLKVKLAMVTDTFINHNNNVKQSDHCYAFSLLKLASGLKPCYDHLTPSVWGHLELGSAPASWSCPNLSTWHINRNQEAFLQTATDLHFSWLKMQHKNIFNSDPLG